MYPDVADLLKLVEVAVTAFSMLGGAMAAFSGYLATQEYLQTRSARDLTEELNRGIVFGFASGVPAAVWASMIVLGS